jgi:hypothetical protein
MGFCCLIRTPSSSSGGGRNFFARAITFLALLRNAAASRRARWWRCSASNRNAPWRSAPSLEVLQAPKLCSMRVKFSARIFRKKGQQCGILCHAKSTAVESEGDIYIYITFWGRNGNFCSGSALSNGISKPEEDH